MLISPKRSGVRLDDVYTQTSGRVLMNGIQALVRLPMVQIRRDRAAGLNTGGFISGYRGSPLGGYDTALGKAKKFLSAHDIIAQPAVNEDLAAPRSGAPSRSGSGPAPPRKACSASGMARGRAWTGQETC